MCEENMPHEINLLKEIKFLRPDLFQELLDRSHVKSELYNAMKKDDLAEVVITALNILKNTNHLPTVTKAEKSEKKSDVIRESGNKFLMKMNYKTATDNYNKALASAPKNSRAMTLAYSNRSYVMFKLKRFQACISDIDICFSLGCPEEIRQKLINRRQEANKFATMESLTFTSLKRFTNNYFNFTSMCHSDLPSVSERINVNIEYCQPKITAASDIKSGTIIAVEEAYMSAVMPHNYLNSCYYCLKITPVLIPCDNCCVALFCSNKCRTKCNQEYHIDECQMMEVIYALCDGALLNLMIKSVFKLKRKLPWKAFIKASKTMGNSRINKSSTKEIFNSEHDCALLTFPENKAFIHGVMFNSSFVCATLLHCIAQIPSFLPNSPDDNEAARRAIARVMMYLSIYGSPNFVAQTVTDLVTDKTNIQKNFNAAWYTFYGKLKTACSPNVIVSWIHNKAVVIALRKIKSGEEIATSFLDPSMSIPEQEKHFELMKGRGTVCSCSNCTEGLKNDTLSRSQAEFVKNVNLVKLRSELDIWNVTEIFDRVCQVMDLLNDVPRSKEYCDALYIFRNCLIVYEAIETENFDIK